VHRQQPFAHFQKLAQSTASFSVHPNLGIYHPPSFVNRRLFARSALRLCRRWWKLVRYGRVECNIQHLLLRVQGEAVCFFFFIFLLSLESLVPTLEALEHSSSANTLFLHGRGSNGLQYCAYELRNDWEYWSCHSCGFATVGNEIFWTRKGTNDKEAKTAKPFAY